MFSREAVTQEIQKRIFNGSLRVGSRLPSERDLAEDFGVGRGAIQLAIRELESLGFLSRLPNCRPTVISKGTPQNALTDQKPALVAIWILPELQDLGGTLILQGIREVFGVGNYNLLVGCAPAKEQVAFDRAELDFFNSLAKNGNVAGAIVWDSGNLACGTALQSMVAAGTPLIFIDREPQYSIQADVVATNNRRASRIATRHLIELGHRRIDMVLSGERVSSVDERIEGYLGALREAGTAVDNSNVLDLPIRYGVGATQASEELLTELMQKDDRPTALFAANDFVALNLLEAARNLHIDVPAQLSIVGFDWLLRWLPSGGELTTISQPFEEIGRTAARRLLERIERSSSETPRHILLDGHLVVKRTTSEPYPGSNLSLASKAYETRHTSVYAR